MVVFMKDSGKMTIHMGLVRLLARTKVVTKENLNMAKNKEKELM